MHYVLPLLAIILLAASVSAGGFTVQNDSLANLCGYDTPLTSVAYYSSDGGVMVPITNPALLNELNTGQGLTAPNVHAAHYVTFLVFNPGNHKARLYYHGSGSRPWRLHCEANGNIVRTDSPVFDCMLFGVCQ